VSYTAGEYTTLLTATTALCRQRFYAKSYNLALLAGELDADQV